SARQGLLDITKQADVLAATGDDAFDDMVMAHYRALAIAAPAVVRNAFRDILS
ncbi:MAG: hypothetical protein JWQ72_3203, partial [Polaromonas sp.]|nr:hypothetical protein [Polaromonas sp.]